MEAYEDKYIMIFASHSQATYLYNELQKKGVNIEFISTPGKISLGCSKSIIFYHKDITFVADEVKKTNAKINGIYKMIKNDDKYDYIKVE